MSARIRSIIAACLTGILPAAAADAQSPAAPPLPPPEADSLFFAGAYAKARTAYDAFIAKNPLSLQAQLRAGYAAVRLGRPEDAAEYFDKVVAGAPGGRAPVALAGLAMAHAVRGDKLRALELLERADSAGYLHFEVLDQDAALTAIRREPRFAAIRERVYQRAYPCAADPRARAFDFWIGDWDVYPNGAARVAGRSVIQRASGGCMILENWTSVAPLWGAPYEGKSINFVDTTTGKWKQVWSGSGRDVTQFENGEYRDGAMRFTYRRTNAQGQVVEGDFIFYNLGPDRVRQFQDASTDGGKTRQVSYDFIYVRKGSGASPRLPRPQ